MNHAERELIERRREIAEAAIAIADEQGIDAVSMRNIAARLGVGTMTLYTWVENKDDLIAVMTNALSEQMLVPEPMPTEWREALTLIAVATRDVFAAHPWMISRSQPVGRIGANMLRHVDQSLRAVKELDLEWPLRASVLQAVDNYALGYAVANQRRAERAEKNSKDRAANDYAKAFDIVGEARAHKARATVTTSRGDAANAIEVRALFESGDAPALTEMFGSAESAIDRISGGPPEIDSAWDDGLSWMLDGIAAMLDAHGAR